MSASTRILCYNLQSVDLALLALGTAVAGYPASCHFSHIRNWYDPRSFTLLIYPQLLTQSSKSLVHTKNTLIRMGPPLDG